VADLSATNATSFEQEKVDTIWLGLLNTVTQCTLVWNTCQRDASVEGYGIFWPVLL